MKATYPTKFSVFNLGLAALFFLTMTTTSRAQVVCVETNGVKYLQPPNLAGFDVSDCLGYVLADDFVCTNTGPISDIHIWGSWLNDVHGQITNFWLGIYSDVPAVVNPAGPPTPSHPGNLLWSESFTQAQFAESELEPSQEQFISPASVNAIGTDAQVWYYCFYPTSPYTQTGSVSAPVAYWLAAYAQGNFGPAVNSTPQYGWKTTSGVQNDTSVNALWTGSLPGNNAAWTPTTTPADSPEGAQPLDLAFMLNTPTNSTPPVVCIETNGIKYVQGPKTLGGFDVWNTPYVLADDFVCTNFGPITDIHLWGSWLEDIPLTNSITFWLGIYDDVPVGPGNTFSHPGTNLLWQQWFAPGQYAETIWTANASEEFLDPGRTNVIGTDSVVWYYCFYPTNPFEQLGTSISYKTYWLAAYAQLPVGIGEDYGWKTTTNVLNDVSVHAPWPGVAPTNNPGWTPTGYQPPTGAPFVPLDLAFLLTTPTNCISPIEIRYLSTNKVVLTWSSGYLQVSTSASLSNTTSVEGPYTDVPGATSPYTNDVTLVPIKFYRLRCN